MGETPIMQIVLWLQNALLLGLGFAAFYHGLQLIPVRQRRVVFRQPGAPEPVRLPPASLLKAFGIRGDSDSMEEKRQLLAGAGIRLPVLRFELLRRAGLVLMLAAGLWGYAGRSHPVLLLYLPPCIGCWRLFWELPLCLPTSRCSRLWSVSGATAS
ncbi:hypothetical protein N6H14_16490 [Paenibacillus sp. CC-CFT747]|nr:hypothetical protein N6H14_16490 [Paenibacillus sp. CC-CFT747]